MTVICKNSSSLINVKLKFTNYSSAILTVFYILCSGTQIMIDGVIKIVRKSPIIAKQRKKLNVSLGVLSPIDNSNNYAKLLIDIKTIIILCFTIIVIYRKYLYCI